MKLDTFKNGRIFAYGEVRALVDKMEAENHARKKTFVPIYCEGIEDILEEFKRRIDQLAEDVAK